jgi:hypothetical protein
MGACRCAPFRLSPFFPLFCQWLLFSRPGFEARGAQARTSMDAYAPLGTASSCAAFGLAPAMYVKYIRTWRFIAAPPSYGYCRWVYEQCIPLFPIPLRTVDAAVGTGGGMGMMLPQLSSSSGAGTVLQGVRGVHGQDVLWEGCRAWRGMHVCVYSRRSVNLSAYGVPVYDGSAWGTPQDTMQAGRGMLRERMARDGVGMDIPKKEILVCADFI